MWCIRKETITRPNAGAVFTEEGGIGIQILLISGYMLVKATSSGLSSMDTDFKGFADQTFHTESASCQDKDFKVLGEI